MKEDGYPEYTLEKIKDEAKKWVVKNLGTDHGCKVCGGYVWQYSRDGTGDNNYKEVLCSTCQKKAMELYLKSQNSFLK